MTAEQRERLAFLAGMASGAIAGLGMIEEAGRNSIYPAAVQAATAAMADAVSAAVAVFVKVLEEERKTC